MANEQHPGPWRWGLTDKVGGSAGVLEDANGRAVIRSADNGRGFMRATASAAALIAAAPEMLELLRKVTDEYEALVRSDYQGSDGQRFLKTPEITEARMLLARIDGVSK